MRIQKGTILNTGDTESLNLCGLAPIPTNPQKDRTGINRTETDRNGQKQRATDRNRQKRIETYRNGQKWTETVRSRNRNSCYESRSMLGDAAAGGFVIDQVKKNFFSVAEN